MSTVKHLDELAEFHVRDLTRLTPGARVLFGHVPTLGDPELSENTEQAYGELAVIHGVRDASFAELHRTSVGEEWAMKKAPVIFHTGAKDPSDEPRHRYASDSGVIRYDRNSAYNDTNFTVLLDDLEAAGVELSLELSDTYELALTDFNSKVRVYEFLDELDD